MRNNNLQTFILTFKDNNGQEKEIRFYCTINDGRVGFQHRATFNIIQYDFENKHNNIINNDKFYKVQYYNRTWETYRYQTLLVHTARTLLKEKYITAEEEKQIQEKIENLPYNLTYNSIVNF